MMNMPSHETVLIICSVLIISIALGLTMARPGFVRGIAIFLTLSALPLMIITPDVEMGRPKPLTRELIARSVPEAAVLSVTLVENKAIYLTLLWGNEPGLYSMPWDANLAMTLISAVGAAARIGTHPIMRAPFAAAWNGPGPRFYAAPNQNTAPSVAPPAVALGKQI